VASIRTRGLAWWHWFGGRRPDTRIWLKASAQSDEDRAVRLAAMREPARCGVVEHKERGAGR
jgi:hypothetical protein